MPWWHERRPVPNRTTGQNRGRSDRMAIQRLRRRSYDTKQGRSDSSLTSESPSDPMAISASSFFQQTCSHYFSLDNDDPNWSSLYNPATTTTQQLFWPCQKDLPVARLLRSHNRFGHDVE